MQNFTIINRQFFDGSVIQGMTDGLHELTSNTYDRENRVAVKNDLGNLTIMSYNGEGQRVVRQTPIQRATFVWDGSDYIQERTS